jgi:hypothetical protein
MAVRRHQLPPVNHPSGTRERDPLVALPSWFPSVHDERRMPAPDRPAGGSVGGVQQAAKLRSGAGATTAQRQRPEDDGEQRQGRIL